VRVVVTADAMTSVTEGAKGRQTPGFFTHSNKRWRLPLFCSFATSRSLLDKTLRLKFWRLNVFSGPTAAVGLAKRLLLLPAQRVVGSPVHSAGGAFASLGTIHATSDRPEYRYWLVTIT
jgi:hypothetical protein